MHMTPNVPGPRVAEPLRYCAVAISQLPPSGPRDVNSIPILLFVLNPSDGSLRIKVDAQWREVVLASSLEYVSELIADLKTRLADGDSVSIFEQVCELNVGPLRTVAVGNDLSADLEALAMMSTFVQI